MRWNHRVVDMTDENDGDPLFAVREVYYHDNAPAGHCEPSVMSDTKEGLKRVLEQMTEALDQPVLKSQDFTMNKIIKSCFQKKEEV